jgi:hypothetical protein
LGAAAISLISADILKLHAMLSAVHLEIANGHF